MSSLICSFLRGSSFSNFRNSVYLEWFIVAVNGFIYLSIGWDAGGSTAVTPWYVVVVLVGVVLYLSGTVWNIYHN